MPALETHVVVFDTEVVNLTDKCHDPVDVLFGVQLGGGTDINRAVAYCQGLMQIPLRFQHRLLSARLQKQLAFEAIQLCLPPGLSRCLCMRKTRRISRNS